jgi:hypothetical protein
MEPTATDAYTHFLEWVATRDWAQLKAEEQATALQFVADADEYAAYALAVRGLHTQLQAWQPPARTLRPSAALQDAVARKFGTGAKPTGGRLHRLYWWPMMAAAAALLVVAVWYWSPWQTTGTQKPLDLAEAPASGEGARAEMAQPREQTSGALPQAELDAPSQVMAEATATAPQFDREAVPVLADASAKMGAAADEPAVATGSATFAPELNVPQSASAPGADKDMAMGAAAAKKTSKAAAKPVALAPTPAAQDLPLLNALYK